MSNNGDDDSSDLEGMVGPFVEDGALYAVSDELAILLLGWSWIQRRIRQ